jgi:hypothetical protein
MMNGFTDGEDLTPLPQDGAFCPREVDALIERGY